MAPRGAGPHTPLPSPLISHPLSPERRSHQANPAAHLTGEGDPGSWRGEGGRVSWGDQTDGQHVRALIHPRVHHC